MSYRRNVRIVTNREPAISTSRVISTSRQPVSTHTTRIVTNEPVITRRERVIRSEPIVTHRSYVTEPLLTHHRVIHEPIITEQRTVTSATEPSKQKDAYVLGDMEKQLTGELEGRNRDWENQVEKMQQDFFGGKVITTEGASAARSSDGLDLNNSKNLFTELPDGSRVFRVRFDLHDFEPEDMKVRTEHGILHIVAQKEIKEGSDRKTRRFNRTVEIPSNVNPDLLTSSFSEDGILTIEAPAPPEYSSLTKSIESSEIPVVASISRTIPGDASKDPISRLNTPFILGKDGEQRMKLVIDIGTGYKSEDVVVHAYGTKVVVEGKYEENIGGRVSRKRYSREFDLPEFVDPFTMRARWSDNGRLSVGAMCLGYRCHQDDAIKKVEEDLPEDGKVCTVETY